MFVYVCVRARVNVCVCVFSERGQGEVSVERAREGGGKEDNDTRFLLLTCYFTDQALLYGRD